MTPNCRIFTWFNDARGSQVAAEHSAQRGEITPRMQDLYRRLRERGFDRAFLQKAVLPEWWEDALGAIPSNRALAEASIARHLKFDIGALRNPDTPLPCLTVDHLRFKKRKGTESIALCPAVVVSQQLAAIVSSAVKSLPNFEPNPDPAVLRAEILSESPFVNLESLLSAAWKQGVIVLHARTLPSGPKFDGIAMFVQETPVIVLASSRKSPPWLAYHLGHELGHLHLGHVKPGDDPLVDSNIASAVDDDEHEKQADAFAMTLLTGRAEVSTAPVLGLTSPKLVQVCRQKSAETKIDPGTLALIYGKSADRMGVAQNALKELGLDKGAHRKIAKALLQYLNIDEIPESCQRLVESVALDPELVAALEHEDTGSF